ncbi:hypothetical protein HGM15179_004982 [Zosterops borbonicus]|uniref:Uncharacterized protein n=1 Tax=Zosterops borbonicus TaxID=364589 RepID=A0A8K1GPS9_9PASS|nr:hypothetical protein HGM15179_004982 [Zosterops borbonicus]
MSAGSGSGAGGAAGTATSALCLLLSLTAVAVCLLLGAKTAELQGRLAALEERGAAGHGPLLDALQPRVEQLFREDNFSVRGYETVLILSGPLNVTAKQIEEA